MKMHYYLILEDKWSGYALYVFDTKKERDSFSWPESMTFVSTWHNHYLIQQARRGAKKLEMTLYEYIKEFGAI